jgi:hypothetical protein
LQVGAVTNELTQKVMSILEADSRKMRRLKSINFFDKDEQLINKLATQYDGLKTVAQFAHMESANSNLLLEIKDNSVDLAILCSQQQTAHEWIELVSRVVSVLKPGGKLLIIGHLEQESAM